MSQTSYTEFLTDPWLLVQLSPERTVPARLIIVLRFGGGASDFIHADCLTYRGLTTTLHGKASSKGRRSASNLRTSSLSAR